MDINKMTLSEFLRVCEQEQIERWGDLNRSFDMLKTSIKNDSELPSLAINTESFFRGLFLCVQRLVDTKRYGKVEDNNLRFLIDNAKRSFAFMDNEQRENFESTSKPSRSLEWQKEMSKLDSETARNKILILSRLIRFWTAYKNELNKVLEAEKLEGKQPKNQCMYLLVENHIPEKLFIDLHDLIERLIAQEVYSIDDKLLERIRKIRNHYVRGNISDDKAKPEPIDAQEMLSILESLKGITFDDGANNLYADQVQPVEVANLIEFMTETNLKKKKTGTNTVFRILEMIIRLGISLLKKCLSKIAMDALSPETEAILLMHKAGG